MPGIASAVLTILVEVGHIGALDEPRVRLLLPDDRADRRLIMRGLPLDDRRIEPRSIDLPGSAAATGSNLRHNPGDAVSQWETRNQVQVEIEHGGIESEMAASYALKRLPEDRRIEPPIRQTASESTSRPPLPESLE